MPPAPFLASSRFQSKLVGTVSADSQRCHSSRKNAARFRPASAVCRSVSVPPSGGWSLLQLNALRRFSSSPPPQNGLFRHRSQLVQTLGRHQQVGVVQEKRHVETGGRLADLGLCPELGGQIVGKGLQFAAGAPSRTTIRSEAAPKFFRKSLKRFATAVFWGSSACREV